MWTYKGRTRLILTCPDGTRPRPAPAYNFVQMAVVPWMTKCTNCFNEFIMKNEWCLRMYSCISTHLMI